MSTARFEVYAKLDGAGALKRGTVLIDRTSKEVIVRPLGSHKTYSLPLDTIATWICQQNLLVEMRDAKLAKKAKKAAQS